MSLTNYVGHFRFRNDNGSEISATWMAAQDTDASLTLSGDTPFRLRLAIAQSGVGSIAETFQLQVSHNGGAATTIGSSSSYVKGYASSNLTNGANTTEQLSVPGTATYVTEPGCVSATNATPSSITLGANDKCTEVEWALEAIGSQLSPGDSLVITLIDSTGAVTQFSPSITLSIQGSPYDPNHLMMMGVGW